MVTGVMMTWLDGEPHFYSRHNLYPICISIFVNAKRGRAPTGWGAAAAKPADYGLLWRVLICVYMTAVLGSIVQSTTVALPEIFEDGLSD